MSSYAFGPERCLEPLLDARPRELAFRPGLDFPAWQKRVRRKLKELLGGAPERVKPNVRIESHEDNGLFRETRFVFASEANADVPCHLLVPKEATTPVPIVICLQGHSTGMHISLGRVKYKGDEECFGGDRDFALQAVKQGYAALVLEQRCFGEREDARKLRDGRNRCDHPSLVGLLLGRPMIGQRVWDVSRAIDMLDQFPEVDRKRIGCMGNSGGGTITYFAACVEPRISIAMPSCYVCTFRDSIGKLNHCPCNYVPGILRYLEMGDMAGAIAPRWLVVVAGETDDIFPIAAVKETFKTIQAVYRAAGVANRCRLVVGPEGHRFYADLGWAAFKRMAKEAWAR
jgi:dienelactone hydrolase